MIWGWGGSSVEESPAKTRIQSPAFPKQSKYPALFILASISSGVSARPPPVAPLVLTGSHGSQFGQKRFYNENLPFTPALPTSSRGNLPCSISDQQNCFASCSCRFPFTVGGRKVGCGRFRPLPRAREACSPTAAGIPQTFSVRKSCAPHLLTGRFD